MSKARNTRKTSGNSRTSDETNVLGRLWGRLSEWATPMVLRRLRILAGVFGVLTALFLLVAMCSHFVNGSQDQSIRLLSSPSPAPSGQTTDPTPMLRPVTAPQAPANWGGAFGAWCARGLITNGFGAVAVMIPLMLALLGLALLDGRLWVLVRRVFGPFFFLLYWASMTLAGINTLFGLDNLDMGGRLGLSLNEWLGFYLGGVGVGLLLFFAGLAFVVVKFRRTLTIRRFSNWLFAKLGIEVPEALAAATAARSTRRNRHNIAAETDESDLENELDADADLEDVIVSRRPVVTETQPQAESKTNTDSTPDTDGIRLIRKPKHAAIQVETDDKEALEDSDVEMEADTEAAPNTPQAKATKADTTQTGLELELEIAPRGDDDEEEPASQAAGVQRQVGPVAAPTSMPAPRRHTQPIAAGPAPETDAAIQRENDYAILAASLSPKTAVDTSSPTVELFSIDLDAKPANPRHTGSVELSIESTTDGELDLGGFRANVEAMDDDTLRKYTPPGDTATLDEDEDVGEWEAYDPTRDLSDYQYPTIDLLNVYEKPGQEQINREELQRFKDMIVETLLNFKIEITSIKATIGPTITLYEIVPAPHIRISKVKSLEDDIAMRLKALRCRIIAPMPGKGTIGIEVPNSKPEVVSFRSLIATEKFRSTNMDLPLAIGKSVTNEVIITDLAKMPHLLVAGATGMGKSVGLNCMIASLLYKKHPAQLKFVLIDPKKVEMTLFETLRKHFLAKLPDHDDAIITDMQEVVKVLNSLCVEMDNRYLLLQQARVRNIKEYNEKFTNRKLNPNKGHRYLPYIVLVIDELADLMMTAGKEVEPPICRLAQLARAIGIHLIVATQRPSVDIITGKIKANFPARLAFAVSSKIDSRTILDGNGAEQLIGKGDLLLRESNDLVRVQNAFLDTPEVERVTDFIGGQRGYPDAYELPEAPSANGDSDEAADWDGEFDDMFAEAARLVVHHQQGSTSLIQRRMKLGYNRAGRIMDQLERAGIVGPANGSKPREVLVMDEYDLQHRLPL